MLKRTLALLLLAAGIARADIGSIVTFPAGSSGDVQFNQSRRFGADTGRLTYSTATHTLNTEGISVSTFTANGVSYTFPATQTGGYFLRTNGAGGLTWETPSDFFVSSGVALAVMDGSTQISSPTAAISFEANQFTVSLQGSTSAFIQLNPSTATLLGPSIDLASEVTGSLPPSSVAAGSLGTSVIASSIAAAAVLDGSIVSVTGSKVSGNIPGNSVGVTGTVNVSQVIGAVTVYPTTATASFPYGLSGTTVTLSAFNASASSVTVNGSGGLLVSGAGGTNSTYGLVTTTITASTITATRANFSGGVDASSITVTTAAVGYLNGTNAIYAYDNTIGGQLKFYDNVSDNHEICRMNQNGFGCSFGGSVTDPSNAIEGATTSGTNNIGVKGSAATGGPGVGVQGIATTGDKGVEGVYQPNANQTGYAVYGRTVAAGASATEHAGFFSAVVTAGATAYGVKTSATGGALNYGLYVAAGQSVFIDSATFKSASGARVDYNLTAGSITARNITGSTQCLQADSSGNVTGTGSVCGGSGGTSVYPATATASFPFGFSASTITVSTITFSISSAGVMGASDASIAYTGIVGERKSSVVSALTNFPSSASYGDLTSLSITAGDWDCTALMAPNLNGASITENLCGVTTTPGNSSAGTSTGDTLFEGPLPTASFDNMCVVPAANFNLAVSTTVYLKYAGNYSGGPPRARGRLTCRRKR